MLLKSRSRPVRSEEHTSELQSRVDLVCRLLLEKKKEKPLQLLIENKKQETTVKSPDISAEYGRFSGVVINLITKSGGYKFCRFVFFFNDTATTEIYTLSLHDALPI